MLEVVGSKRAAWMLAIAMLPMLSYMGHWENPVAQVQGALLGEHAHGAHAAVAHEHTQAEHNHHAQHCHGEVASCSDIPYAGSASIVFLSYAIHGLAWSAPRWLQNAEAPIAPRERPEMPATPPPKMG